MERMRFMEQRLIEIILEVLDIDEAVLRSRWDDRTIWDSLARVNVLFVIEDELDIFFEESELSALTTPKALVEAVMEKGLEG